MAFIWVLSTRRSLAEYLSVCGNYYYVPRDEFAAILQRLLCGHFNAAAARNFHPYDSYTLDVVVFDYFRQFLRVIDVIQFRTADKSDFVLDESVVEIAIGICCAVCRYQQVCSLEVWSPGRCELDLYRPLRQL